MYWDPTPAESRYRQRLESSFLSTVFRGDFIKLLDAFRVYLDSSDSDQFTNSEDEASADEMTPVLARFALLALEYVKWILAGCTEGGLDGQTDFHISRAIMAAAAVAPM